MLKKLRWNLTVLAASLTGAVLLVMALAALSMAEGQLRASGEAAFQSNINAIVAKLQTDRVVSLTWLSQTEASEHLIVSIRDGGVPLHFPGAWTPDTERSTLIAYAEEAARAIGVDASLPPLSVIDTVSTTFEIRGDHADRYLGAVVLLPAHGNFLSLVLLRDMSDRDAQAVVMRVSFAVLIILGVAALFGLCWFFSGRAIQPIEESQRKQAEFIAAASHELRSPLAVIRTSAEAMEVDPAQAYRLTRSIESECARMARLVDDLLTLARSDAGSWSIRHETVDVDALLLETADLFSPIARQRNQTLALDVPDTALPAVSGDPQRLKQVLTVLLDNAFSYTPPGGAVTLSASSGGKWLTLRVSDTGPGIGEAHVGHIFERFYRADQARSGKEHFGLGLSIAEELAGLHHGILRVAETGKGGTTFELKLPIG